MTTETKLFIRVVCCILLSLIFAFCSDFFDGKQQFTGFMVCAVWAIAMIFVAGLIITGYLTTQSEKKGKQK